MDSYVDERDYRLLNQDRCTFFVLRRIIEGNCQLLLSDHERLIICYTGEPYPVWIWMPDLAPESVMEEAYRHVLEHGLLVSGRRINLKVELAEYIIQRAARDGIKLPIATNMFAYTCQSPLKPAVKADGGIHRCTMEDTDELVEFFDQFHREIGIDLKDTDGYRADAQACIETGNMYLWKTENGESVSSCKYAPNGGMAAVNLVYTRPEHRRKHYAENLVYEVTLTAIQDGYIPMLYTDADYSASNACYTRIGYELRGRLCTLSVMA